MKIKNKNKIMNLIEKLEKEKWPKYITVAILLYIGMSFLRDAMIAVNPENQNGVFFANAIWIISFIFPIAIKLDINYKLKKLKNNLEEILRVERLNQPKSQIVDDNNQQVKKLEKLRELFDRNLITEEEYKIKKQEILKEL